MGGRERGVQDRATCNWCSWDMLSGALNQDINFVWRGNGRGDLTCNKVGGGGGGGTPLGVFIPKCTRSRVLKLHLTLSS